MTQFSSRCKNLRASPIREILSVIDKPGMISFAGGLPAAETFCTPDFSELPVQLLQYGPSEGEWELRELVCKELATAGLHCQPEQILILSGSQQGIDLVAKLFIDSGTIVAVESPTYLAALQAFRFFGATFTSLANLENSDCTPSFAYTIPTFQNPTGYCYTKQERDAVAKLCNDRGIPLFEDDPYRDLVYNSCERQPICSQLKSSPWIYQSSFSKTYAPGLRLGFLVCSEDLIVPLTRLKQAADLHSNRISQWLVMRQLKDSSRSRKMSALASSYKAKRDAFAQLLTQHFNDLAIWEIPKGGLFFWLTLKRAVDTQALLEQAIQLNVAFMPGENFFPFFDQQHEPSCLRLNFSHASTAQAEAGLKILATILRAA